MKSLQIFEPAMCCPTGVCGPSVDQDLLRITTLMNHLENAGVEVGRFNLTNDPMVFIENKMINKIITEEGVTALPVIVANGQILAKGTYPSTESICTSLSVDAPAPKAEPKSTMGFTIVSGDCSGEDGCC